jgi:signal transduction histidine kinase
VLIVDDHVALADNLRELVLEMGEGEHDASAGVRAIEVTVTGSGGRALEAARLRGFDVAIVDVKLPDMSGVDLLPLLREAAPLGEVILITGFATIDAAIAALRGGAFAMMLKSFRPEELQTTVEQALLKVALRRDRDALERRYRALVDVADVIVVGLDEAGHGALVNPKFLALTGASPELAAASELCERWIVSADRGRFREAVASVAAGRGPSELEASLMAPVVVGGVGGVGAREAARIIRWHLSAEAEGHGAGPGLVFGIGVDVTDRRALERRAANAEALSTMGTLALGLAHEIRNPLNAAVLQLTMLARGIERHVADEAQRGSMRDRAQIVMSEIKRLGRLLTEFLDLARPRGLARESLPLDDLLDAVVELHAEEAAQRGIAIRRASPARRISIVGDREKLRQVFVNLLVNAMEATPDGGEVELVARVEGARVIVEIRDTGQGIAEDDLPRLFDPFFTTKPGGTGLGLSIVRKILEQHGGTISLRSRVGMGTTTVVELPADGA